MDWNVKRGIHMSIQHEPHQQISARLTTRQVAELLNVSTITITNYVRRGILQPLNPDTKIIDDTSSRKNEEEPTFLTVQQAHRRHFLFHSFKNPTGEWARLVHMNKHGRREAQTESGHIYSLERLLEMGFSPVTSKKRNPPITLKGHLVFLFEKSSNIHSLPYRAMEWMIQRVGVNNVKVQEEAARYYLHVKPCVIEFDPVTYQDEREALHSTLVGGGEIMVFKGRWLLKSNLEPFTLYFTVEEKEQIRQLVKEANCTIEEFIKRRLFD
jgi:hypothetical protein